MNKTSPLVIALLFGSASAIQNKLRPTAGSVPWGSAATRPTWDTPDYPVNYFIPNFGADTDMLTTMNSLKIAEGQDRTALRAKFAQKDQTDLRMPNLGQDEDVKYSLASIEQSQKESGRQLPGLTFDHNQVSYAQSGIQDQEIADTVGAINFAEKRLNHKLASDSASNVDIPYNQSWQQLGADEEIAMSQTAVAESEKMYGKFVPVKDEDGLWRVGKEDSFVQTELSLESDPIGNSAGAPQYMHPPSTEATYPMNYSVPHFGMDRDIQGSLEDVNAAEKIVGHSWTWKKKSRPGAGIFYPGAERGLDADMVTSLANMGAVEKKMGGWDLVQLGQEQTPYNLNQVKSDPIGSSIGQTQYLHGKAARRGYDIDYAVPNFGMDIDIKGGLANMKVAEKVVGHQWEDFGSAASVEKYSNPAKKTNYDFAPELEGNIKDSIKNLSASETVLGRKYNLSLLQMQSDPIGSSIGNTQYLSPASKEAKYPMDYSVPHFGMDRDVQGSLENMKVAEKVVGHEWKGIDGAKYANPAKAVDYNFAPKLEGDMIDSATHLASTESRLKHTYTLA